MHFVLVGPGALGCLLASMLARADHNEEYRFTLLDHNAARAGKLTSQGIVYEYKGRQERAFVPVSSSPTETGVADIVILCVKSYDIQGCLGFCGPLLGPDTLLLFMQNGVAHLEKQSLIKEATPAYGTTTEGANLVGPGHVRHAGRGLTQFGFLGPVPEQAQKKLQRVSNLFTQAGLKARVTEDILSRLWTKLMVNTGINGLTATLNCTNGELLTLPNTPGRMARLVEEALVVARASNIYVPEDSLEITKGVCVKTAANISSMLQDVRAQRKTEIDAINGAVVAVGKRLGIATPENLLLVRQVKELESSYLKR
jgi:2-dehydropantoate 2-reductase